MATPGNDKEPTKQEMRERAARRRAIENSDKRIANALQALDHNRGKNALCNLKVLLQGEARGLDSAGMKALQTLIGEFSKGRRDFVDKLPSVVLPPKPQPALEGAGVGAYGEPKMKPQERSTAHFYKAGDEFDFGGNRYRYIGRVDDSGTWYFEAFSYALNKVVKFDSMCQTKPL